MLFRNSQYVWYKGLLFLLVHQILQLISLPRNPVTYTTGRWLLGGLLSEVFGNFVESVHELEELREWFTCSAGQRVLVQT
ncbi:hypothetical protein KCV03_g292, partial [Aureobasidium melanogenum]